MLTKTGALQAVIAKLARRFSGYIGIFIPLLSLVFALICTTQAVNMFIAFAPVMVMLSLALGLDSICGVAIIILGGAIGFSTGTLNVSTTVISQKIADLPLYSGDRLPVRLFRRVLCGDQPVFDPLCQQDPQEPATQPHVRSGPEKCPGKGPEAGGFRHHDAPEMDHHRMSGGGNGTDRLRQHYEGLGCGGARRGVPCAGHCGGPGGRLLGQRDFKGVSDGLQGYAGRGYDHRAGKDIGTIMGDGNIIDTVVHTLAGILNVVPFYLQGIGMLIANTIINVFITSGSGQASVVMPIMIPLADLLGMTRQTAILAFNFGDGFAITYCPPPRR